MKKFNYRKSSEDSADVDMTPMLDIVFIMLIFFIVTAVFLDERGLDFTLPGDNGAASDKATIQIFVDAKNRVSVDRVPVILSGVPARVERLLAEKPDAGILLMASAKANVDPVVFIKDQMNASQRQTSVKIIRD